MPKMYICRGEIFFIYDENSVMGQIVPSPDMCRGPTHLQTGNGWVGGMFSMDFACFLYRGPTHLQTGNGWVHAIRTGAVGDGTDCPVTRHVSWTHPFTGDQWVGRWNVFDGFCLFLYRGPTHLQTGNGWVHAMIVVAEIERTK